MRCFSHQQPSPINRASHAGVQNLHLSRSLAIWHNRDRQNGDLPLVLLPPPSLFGSSIRSQATVSVEYDNSHSSLSVVAITISSAPRVACNLYRLSLPCAPQKRATMQPSSLGNRSLLREHYHPLNDARRQFLHHLQVFKLPSALAYSSTLHRRHTEHTTVANTRRKNVTHMNTY